MYVTAIGASKHDTNGSVPADYVRTAKHTYRVVESWSAFS